MVTIRHTLVIPNNFYSNNNSANVLFILIFLKYISPHVKVAY